MKNITSKLKKGVEKNGKKIAIALIIILAIIFIIRPLLQRSYFGYLRLEKRVDILGKISSIDKAAVEREPALLAEYEAVLKELSAKNSTPKPIFTTKNESTGDLTVKFVLGGLYMWFTAIVSLFISRKGRARSGVKAIPIKLLTFLLCAGCGILLAFLGRAIPVVFSPWINGIAYLVLQLIFIPPLFRQLAEKSTRRIRGY